MTQKSTNFSNFYTIFSSEPEIASLGGLIDPGSWSRPFVAGVKSGLPPSNGEGSKKTQTTERRSIVSFFTCFAGAGDHGADKFPLRHPTPDFSDKMTLEGGALLPKFGLHHQYNHGDNNCRASLFLWKPNLKTQKNEAITKSGWEMMCRKADRRLDFAADFGGGALFVR